MKIKRWISVLLVLCMAVSMQPVSVLAASEVASGTCGENLTWVLTDDGTLTMTISGTGGMNDYNNEELPPWGSWIYSIATIVIEDGVTRIGNYAFYECSRVTSVTIPDSVITIGASAFSGCTRLTSVTIPNSVTTIDSYAFDDCDALTSVVIPDNVTTIGYSVFQGCDALTSVTIPEGITSINAMFQGCKSLSSFNIPDSVTKIGTYAFSGCSSLSEIVIPNGVTTIGISAFDYCTGLTNVTIPASVSSIGESAGSYYFGYCSNLEAINVDPENQYYSSIDGVLMSKDQTKLFICPPGKIGSYTVPDTVTFIKCLAFGSCTKLTDVTIGNNVTDPANWLFNDCSSLTTVTLGSGITKIHEVFLGSCKNLDSIIFRGNAPSFDTRAFQYSYGNNNDNKGIVATVYYPADNDTWTTDVMQDYGGTITWVPYEAGDGGSSGENPDEGGSSDEEVVFPEVTDVTFEVRYEITDKDTDGIGSSKFTYKDSYFDDDSTVYNHDLATLSLGMAMSAVTYKDYDDQIIREFLTNIGCLSEETGNTLYNIKTKKFDDNESSDDTCAYAYGLTYLEESDTYLIPVAIRSFGYGNEWVSNFNVVEEGYEKWAAGFRKSADSVYGDLYAFVGTLVDYGIDRTKIKIWVSGFSRGGAIANLLGARLTEDIGIEQKNIYVYTFATPATVKKSAAIAHENIFNIVSDTDIVPRVPLESWKYIRYGITYYLPCDSTSGVNRLYLYSRASEKFKDIMTGNGSSVHYLYYSSQELILDLLMDYLDDAIPSAEHLEQSGIQKILQDAWTGEATLEDIIYRLFVGYEFYADQLIDILSNWETYNYLELGAKAIFLGTAIPTISLTAPEDHPLKWAGGMISEILLRYSMRADKGVKETQIYDSTLTMFADVLENGFNSRLLMQHWGETYLAWMRCGSSVLQRNSYKKVSVKCPVDIVVYDSEGAVVARVTDDVVDDSIEASLCVMVNEYGEKDIYLPDDDEYHIDVSAREAGELDIVVTSFDENHLCIGVDCYIDIPMEEAQTFAVAIPDDTVTTEENVLIPDAVSEDGNTMVEISIVTNLPGIAFGGDTYLLGESVDLIAADDATYGFDGWYLDGELLSEEYGYTFSAVNDLEIEATFHEHSWNEGEITSEAACDAPGVMTYTCNTCGATRTEEILSTGHHYENGSCSVCGIGSVWNTSTNVDYTSVVEALEEAQAGETVQLQADCTEGRVMVTPGVTLDLNGRALTADYAVGFDTAHIIDSAQTGRLNISSKNLVLDEENAMVPVYDGTGYLFTKAGFAIRQDESYTGEGIRINAMSYPTRMDVVELLKDGSEDNNIDVVIRLTWDTADGTGIQEFEFLDQVIRDVYESNQGAWNSYGKMFTMTITGFDGIANLKAHVMVASDTNVAYISSTSLDIT